jgi:hypothetical protein
MIGEKNMEGEIATKKSIWKTFSTKKKRTKFER